MRSFETAGLLALLAIAGCEKDEEPCNNIQCDADCRMAYWSFGICLGPHECACGTDEYCFDLVDNDLDGATDCHDADCGYEGWAELSCNDGIDNDCDGDLDCYDIGDCGASPFCGGCDNATCNAGCIGSGFTGGVCVAGACQCTDDCTTQAQCPATEVCYQGECQAPWSRLYRVTILEGHLPERQWWDDACYDSPCGPPDVVVSLSLAGASCTTSEATDTYNPSWYEYCDITIGPGSVLTWTMLDIDLTVDDEIASNEPYTLTVVDLRAGGLGWTVDYSGTTYEVLSIGIDPP